MTLRVTNWPHNLVCAKFAQTADDGKTYQYKFYSLAAIIAVGYRINSGRATQFRQWATKVLDTFAKQGYVLDKDRLVNGQIFDEDYFEHLVSEIQEIRASERRFYQKITDIYATAIDPVKNNPEALDDDMPKRFYRLRKIYLVIPTWVKRRTCIPCKSKKVIPTFLPKAVGMLGFFEKSV